MKLHYLAPVLLSLVLLAACGKENTESTPKNGEAVAEVSIGNTVRSAMEEARKEIIAANMSLGSKNGTAKGEITPQGDLLIDGKAVSITTEQRQLLIKHRQLLVTIAVSGVEIGMKGVDLAGEAIGETVKGIFSGDTQSIEKKVEAKAEKIEDSARTLCAQLPLLMASQEQLSASLPEFKPYATMTVEDTKDCHVDSVNNR